MVDIKTVKKKKQTENDATYLRSARTTYGKNPNGSVYRKTRLTETRGNLINPDFHKPKDDPGFRQEHVFGAFGFARMERPEFRTATHTETLDDPDQASDEYDNAGATRQQQSTGQRQTSGADDPNIEDAVIVPNRPRGGSSAPGGPEDDTAEGEIVDDDFGSRRTSNFRRDNVIDVEGWDAEPELGQGAGPGVGGPAGLPFRRNLGIGSTQQAAGELMPGRLDLAGAPERTESGALPLSAGSAGMADPVPGFNTGGPTSGPRRTAKRPKPKAGELGKMLGGGWGNRRGEGEGEPSVYEAHTKGYRNIGEDTQTRDPFGR